MSNFYYAASHGVKTMECRCCESELTLNGEIYLSEYVATWLGAHGEDWASAECFIAVRNS